MNLFILRHAEAHPGHPDEQRALTPHGIDQCKRLASVVVQRGLLSRELAVWHSPYRRAVETARIFSAGIGVPESFLRTISGLTPYDEPDSVARMLNNPVLQQDLLIVGHNPNLEMLVTRLLRHDSPYSLIHLNKAGLLCLRRVSVGTLSDGKDSQWQLYWMLP